jgi:hypothetical protein
MDAVYSNWERYSDEPSLPPPKLIDEILDRDYRLYDFHDETSFNRRLYLERKRMERAGKPFLFMVIDIAKIGQGNGNGRLIIKEIVSTLFLATRDIDIKGWYKYPVTVGVLYCEIEELSEDTQDKIFHRMQKVLSAVLAPEQFSAIGMSFHAAPEEKGNGAAGMNE